MIDWLLSHLAPHLCCGCGKIGTLLCDNCKYNIVSEPYAGCLGCGGLTSGTNSCIQCQNQYQKAWCVGDRSGVLQRLIGDFKFQRMKQGYRPLAALLLARIDQLSPATIVVPIPTVSAHIRERGYDHTYLLASRVAKVRGLRLSQSLQRKTRTKQRDANYRTRMKQAKVAFGVTEQLDPTVPYLLIDDVVTTGATIKYAAQALRNAGARTIFVAVIARQPID